MAFPKGLAIRSITFTVVSTPAVAETAIIPTAAAISNAIADAIGAPGDPPTGQAAPGARCHEGQVSMAPFSVWGRWGMPLGHGEMYDTLWGALTDPSCGLGMALLAENLAERYGISREEQDRFACTSQQRAAAAQSEGRLSAEIVAGTQGDGQERRPG